MVNEYNTTTEPTLDAELRAPRTSSEMDYKKFPYTQDDQQRLDNYSYFNELFEGRHYEAFKIRIASSAYNKAYDKLRYVVANFAALVSKVSADFLMGESPTIKVDDGDQEFVDALLRENRFEQQLYESALSSSAMGDGLFKLRIGKRHPNNLSEKETIIIEDTTPAIYFPRLDGFNVRQDPEIQELAWKFMIGDKDEYLYREIHDLTLNQIRTEVWRMKGDKIEEQVGIEVLGPRGIQEVVPTGIDRSMLVHVPNWKTGRHYFGYSDYFDLDALFYALNNRLTKIDNILDKHSDPILAVPPGVLDEKGQVKRESFNLFEVPEGTDSKPEYVVWNASLENAFTEIETLVKHLFLVSETSMDVFGMGEGQSDSGRALRLKIMRTLAKINRKRIYYDRAIKEVVYTAQLLAKAHGIEIDGKKMQGEPVMPEIEWSDGLPIDEMEQVEIEEKRVNAGLTTVADAIVRIDGMDEEMAEKKAKEISDENKVELPQPSFQKEQNPFSKKGNNEKA